MVTETTAPGYKQTEIGVIPEDWKYVKLGNIIQMSKDKSSPPYDNIQKYVGLENIYSDKICQVEYLSAENIASITNRFQTGDILYGKLRPNLNKAALACFNGICSTEILALKTNSKSINKYILYHIKSNKFVEYNVNLSFGTKMPRTSYKIISDYNIPMPPLPEQFAIAQVLSDTDSLIESLDKLIEKKKNIKKGAMQELLSGKKRLPGFHGDWEVKKLGDIIIKQNKTKRKAKDGKKDGNYPFFNNSTKPFDMYLNEFDFDDELIIANTGGLAYFDYYKGKFAVMSDCFVFKTKDVTKFIYYLLKQRENVINEKFFTGSGLRHLDKKLFENIEFKIPSIEEQSAIAEVLSDMDAEIKKLEQKRNKYKQLKIGMMQHLLTGSIRLKC